MEDNIMPHDMGEETEVFEIPEREEPSRGRRKIPVSAAVFLIVVAVILSMSLSALGTIYILRSGGYNELGLSKTSWEKLKWGVNTIRDNYYEDIDDETFVDGALLGMSSSLDEYTIYMPKDYAEEFFHSVSADSYSGVGLYIYSNKEDNSITVISPLEGSPAQKAGITTNDKVTAVDGVPVTGEDIDKAQSMMIGEVGTKVNLTVLKADSGETVTIELTREEIQRETVASEMLDDEIGYIQIVQFGLNTFDEFVKHYNGLCDMGMDKLIIDLRNNPGGYFDQAINIADLFVDKGDVIVYTMNKAGNKAEYISQANPVNIETVILSNEGTASASEVLIGALRDHGKAKVVGTKTFGKGVTQAVIPNDDGSAMKVTDSRYYTPGGVCIDKTGITPDIEVEDGMNEDLQLEAAREELK